MISEERMEAILHTADTYAIPNTLNNGVRELIAEIRELKSQLGSYTQKIVALEATKERLSREADWLARRLEDAEITIMQERQDAYMWREAAREACHD